MDLSRKNTRFIFFLSATVFNEAMWQRVWAAESPKALYGSERECVRETECVCEREIERVCERDRV